MSHKSPHLQALETRQGLIPKKVDVQGVPLW